MNRSDPTSLDHAQGNFIDRELTVEEVVQLQDLSQSQSEETNILTEASEAEGAALPPGPIPAPRPPILIRRNVSGRYRSGGFGFQLELRVDVDGKHPLSKISGDFYQILGATTTYFGSFTVNSPTITANPAMVTIEGLGTYTWSAAAPKIRVTIPRRLIIQPPAPATVQFFTITNQPGATYLCPFVSVFFRTVQYETDHVDDVTAQLFQQYNTGSLPSGGPARTLSVTSAYAEAGIEVQVLPSGPAVPHTEEGTDHVWSDSELHASMVAHFSQWKDIPQWKVWELAAELHELGPNLLGIMFDYSDAHERQGCACFYAGLAGTTADKLRLQLYCYVHELGHCFNLMHSWQKSSAIPPGTDRPGALSYMNYPQLYNPGGGQPGGTNAFWSAFPFQFDDPELIHLRHAFRNHIIMGGDNFRIGAGLEDTQTFDRPVEDNSGLTLEIFTTTKDKSYLFGEPITIRVRLSSKMAEGKTAHPYLHPSAGLVQLGICDPAGNVKVYRPLIEHCVGSSEVRVAPSNPQETSVYCGFGKDGFYFSRTGFYQVRAIYTAVDGSKIMSNVLHLRVRHPVSTEDEEVADRFFGQEQGTLFYLLGSDSEYLKHGNERLNEVLEKYPAHPLADYVRLIQGVNASRTFKIVTPQKRIVARKAKQESISLLSALAESADKSRIDSLTIDSNVLPSLEKAHRNLGDSIAASKVEERRKKGVAAKGKAA